MEKTITQTGLFFMLLAGVSSAFAQSSSSPCTSNSTTCSTDSQTVGSPTSSATASTSQATQSDDSANANGAQLTATYGNSPTQQQSQGNLGQSIGNTTQSATGGTANGGAGGTANGNTSTNNNQSTANNGGNNTGGNTMSNGSNSGNNSLTTGSSSSGGNSLSTGTNTATTGNNTNSSNATGGTQTSSNSNGANSNGPNTNGENVGNGATTVNANNNSTYKAIYIPPVVPPTPPSQLAVGNIVKETTACGPLVRVKQKTVEGTFFGLVLNNKFAQGHDDQIEAILDDHGNPTWHDVPVSDARGAGFQRWGDQVTMFTTVVGLAGARNIAVGAGGSNGGWGQGGMGTSGSIQQMVTTVQVMPCDMGKYLAPKDPVATIAHIHQ